MNERDFELGGKKFKLNKIDAFKQFHIVRRLAPILADLIPAMKNMAATAKNMASASESEKFEAFAEIATPLLNGLSKLSDTDANLVLHGLLASVGMSQQPAGWAKISNGEMLMFADMELPILLQLAGRAFSFNMSAFFALLPQVSSDKG